MIGPSGNLVIKLDKAHWTGLSGKSEIDEYIVDDGGNYKVDYVISLTSVSQLPQALSFGLSVNGLVRDSTITNFKFQGTVKASTGKICMLSLASGDKIDLEVLSKYNKARIVVNAIDVLIRLI